jgi:hypothetical protein
LTLATRTTSSDVSPPTESGELSGCPASRRPVESVGSEAFATRDDAFRRERQVKGWSWSKKQALVDGDWGGLILSLPKDGRVLPKSGSWFDGLSMSGTPPVDAARTGAALE